MLSHRSWAFISLVLFAACTANKVQTAAPTTQNTQGTQDNATAGTALDAFFTGFDGTTDFSILLPRFREISIQDPSIAQIESLSVSLDADTIEELITAAKASISNFDETRFRQKLERQQTVYKITPLKAGETILTTSGGRGGKPGRDQGGWPKTSQIRLVVSAYTAEQMAAGESRYNTEASGNLRSCKSCHESGVAGAPPHELGRIMELSDSEALQWITEGTAKGRTASISHAWGFKDDAGEQGIVAYLRSRQTHDVKTLTRLIIEEQIENGGFKGPAPAK